jgi:spore maturation protein CgeB
MKILVVGDGHSIIHEKAVANTFDKLGHHVKSFYWFKYFHSNNPIKRQWYRAQNKFLLGPLVKCINQDFYKLATKFKPQLIFIYRGTHITSATLVNLKIAMPQCKIYGYNNDDPFAKDHPFWLWRHFIKSIPFYDTMFAYRHHNLNDFKRKGANRVALLRSWFNPDLNFPISLSNKEKLKYSCDVVFVGHYENDGRLEFLEEIVKNGYLLKIFGSQHDWSKKLSQSKVLKHLLPIHPVWKIDYSKAIRGAKIALCFFSKLNRDTYTRRCFEIPAIGTMLLSEYSKDMSSLFHKGKEIDLFKSKKEMISKIKFYLENSNLRKKVAMRGNKKVFSDGHDIVSRMKMIINYYKTDIH